MTERHLVQIETLLSERELFVSSIARDLSGTLKNQEEEIFQSASLELYQRVSLGQHRGTTIQEMARHFWLIIRHQICNLRRSENALKRGSAWERQSTDFQEPAMSGPSPADAADHREQVLSVLALVDGLPARQAEAVRLRYLEGCTHQEIAELMQASRESVNGLLRRGLAELRMASDAEQRRGPSDMVAC